jgi:hypothetical protein
LKKMKESLEMKNWIASGILPEDNDDEPGKF